MPVTVKFDPNAINIQSDTIQDATQHSDGVMSAADKAKLDGLSPVGAGVTEVDTGTGLTGGPITTTGTIELADTAVTPGSYQSADITVDAQGRITAAANGSADGVTSVAAGIGIVCTPDPIVATGTVALANTPVTPGAYARANVTVDQQGRLTAAANGPAVSFAEVAAALGGAAGAHQHWVFKSDGAGSGTMQKNTQVIARYLTVSSSATADVDYNSIGAAVAAATAAGAGPGNDYTIQVFPGFYVEAPITMKQGISVIADTTFDVARSVTVFAALANQDLFTFNGGGEVTGLAAFGVTDPLKCLFRIREIVGATCVGVVNNCVIMGCSNGIVVENNLLLRDAIVSGDSLSILVPSLGLDVGVGVLMDGSRSIGELSRINISVAPAYIPSVRNPIQTGISLLNGAQLGVSTMLSRTSYFDNTQALISSQSGSTAIVRNPFVTGAYNAFQIGAGGANSFINIVGGYLVDNVVNFNILSATGVIFTTVVTDMRKSSIVPGGILSGIIQNITDLATDLVGTSAVQFDSERQASFPQFTHSLQKSGVRTGGDVTDPNGPSNAGLDVEVAAGTGWVVRDAPEDVANIEWDAATLTLPDNEANVYIFVDETTLLPTFSLSAPSPAKILLAIVVTDADIRYIHDAKVLAENIGTNLQNYLLATQKFVLSFGLAAEAGTTVRRFDIDVGAYYRSLELIAYAGVADAEFTSFYGTNGATATPGVVDIDITNYDNAGVLTAMTAGWYRADSVYITSDGQVSVIYGISQHLVQADAANLQIQPPMSFISESAFSIATLIVEEGNGIVQIVDQRVVTARAGAATITNHGSLSGLAADDHPQYLLATGARPMSGNLDMDGNQINNVLDINGVVIEAHAVRHQPGGADAIPTAVAVAVLAGAAATEGVAASLARSDHQHGIATGVPSTIGAANAEGASSSVSRLDHVHAHGNQAGGATHALAVAAGAAGYLSGADKSKLDGITPGAAVASVTGSAPIASSGGVNPDISITPATTLAPGSLSAADKTKLDSVTSGAAVASVGGTAPIVSSGGTAPAISITPATTLAAGSLSAADKTKLDNYPSNPPDAVMFWGGDSIGNAADTRYLFPGYSGVGAQTTPQASLVCPRAGVLKGLFARFNVAAGNGAAVVFTVMVNGVATALTTSLATNAVGQSGDTTHTVAVSQGDRIDIRMVKALAIGSGSQQATVTLGFAGA